MIIIIMAVFAVLAFFANMMIKPKGLRLTVTVVMFAGLVLSVVGIVANMHDHYGMTEEKKIVKKEIHSAGPSEQGFGLLLYQGVGTNGTENVYIYKNTKDATKNTVAKPDLHTTSDRAAINGTKAYKVTTTTRYVYQSSGWKLLFGIVGNNNQLKHRHVVYQIPNTWVALTTEQAQSLQSKMAPKTDKEKMIAAEQQKQLAALAQKDPNKAAMMQVQQIKEIYNIN